MKFLILFSVGLALLPCRVANAWSGAGHQVVAAEAFHELSPQLRAQAFEVLKAHPRFAKWQAAYHTNAPFSLAAYTFMRASVWADEIRRSGDPYDHPNWHFADYPLRRRMLSIEPRPAPTDDVLFGIAQSEKILADTNATAEVRAVYLAYLIHLVGDLHQPLHCASYYSDTYPHGDRGGNDFFVKPAQAGIRLHSLWDGLLGTAANPRTQFKYAAELESRFPRKQLSELAAHTTPEAWSLESRELALDEGYMRGTLTEATNAESAGKLPEGYTKAAKVVAEHQAALAGYRLADEIQKYLKYSKELPLLVEPTNVAPSQTPILKIGALEAPKFYDETMTVTGRIAQVTSRPSATFIELDKPGRASPFTAVIFQESLSQFGDLEQLNGKEVELTGTVTEYHDKPEIILETADQLKAVNK